MTISAATTTATATVPPTPIDPLDHQGLVGSIARQYLRRGVEFEDLVGDGNIGLMMACERFNPALGFKFSTYAKPWIRKTIARALIEGGWPVRIPPYLHVDPETKTGRNAAKGECRAIADRIRNAKVVPATGAIPDRDACDESRLALLDQLKSMVAELPVREAKAIAAAYGIGRTRDAKQRHYKSHARALSMLRSRLEREGVLA